MRALSYRSLDSVVTNLIASGEFVIRPDGSVWRLWPRARFPRCDLQTRRNVCGYLLVKWRYEEVLLHRVVYAAFVGPLLPGLEINHKNGNKTDNRPENLEQVTSRENKLHALRMGLATTDHLPKRLTDDQAREIRRRRTAGERAAVIAHDLGITPTYVYMVARGKARASA